MITKLTIDNFKCFPHPTTFDLSPLNIFTGYNGRGKSSVFQTLLLLAQSFERNGNIEYLEVNGKFIRLDLFEDLINQNNRPDSFIRFILESNAPEYAKVELGYKEQSDRLGEIAELKINEKSYFQQAASISDKDEEKKGSHLYTYPKEFHNLFADYNYIAADRLGPTSYEEKAEIDKANPIGCNGEHRLNMLSKDKKLQVETSKWINYIMDGGTIEVTGKDNKQSAVLNLLFQTNNEKKGIKSVNCGFGYSYILPIVIMALTIKKGCIFIENPEAHLHPKAQSRLMELISKKMDNKDIQVFIETHSEHIINSARLCSLKGDSPLTYKDVSIYFFDKDFQIFSLKMDEDAQISNWPSGFFDQQEIDLAEILKLGLFK